MGCSSEAHKPLAQAADHCGGTSFDLPLIDREVNGHHILLVDLSFENSAAGPFILDTGAESNAILGVDDNYDPKTPRISEPHPVKIKEFEAPITFRAASVPKSEYDYIIANNVNPVVINPMLINEDGFTVVDISHHRLIGFRNEAAVRDCYGYGMRSIISDFEERHATLATDAIVNETARGRVALDTGAILTQLSNGVGAKGIPSPSPEWTYRDISGASHIPLIAGPYTVEIGSVTRTLDVAEVSSQLWAAPRYVGVLGMDILSASILILPPKGSGYWEFKF
jgi:hypothetical protein